MTFDINIFRGLVTLVLLLAFTVLVLWLASPRNKHRFDATARLPLEEDNSDLVSNRRNGMP